MNLLFTLFVVCVVTLATKASARIFEEECYPRRIGDILPISIACAVENGSPYSISLLFEQLSLCTSACIFERVGVINAAGLLNPVGALHFLTEIFGENPLKAERAIENCKNVVAGDYCLNANAVYSCLLAYDL